MSDWTIDSLKEHFDCVLKERDDKICQRFEAIKEAVIKADAATVIHFEDVNNWRRQLDKQEDTFALKGETEKEFDSVRYKQESDVKNIQLQLTEIKEKLQKYENVKQGEGNIWIYIVLIINLIGTITSIYMSVKK